MPNRGNGAWVDRGSGALRFGGLTLGDRPEPRDLRSDAERASPFLSWGEGLKRAVFTASNTISWTPR